MKSRIKFYLGFNDVTTGILEDVSKYPNGETKYKINVNGYIYTVPKRCIYKEYPVK